jgi:hypothetical protein
MFEQVLQVLSLALVAMPPGGAAVAQIAGPRLELARRIAVDPEILGALLNRNRTPESADAIQREDQEWQRNKDYPLRKELTHNGCALQLKKLVQPDTAVVEAFVMDAQGGLVCSTVETSDYWQGDEAKWQRTYGEGKESFMDEPALDASTGKYAIQLSSLIADKGTKVGALTLTLKVSRQQMNP